MIYDEGIGNDSEVRVWLNDPNVSEPNLTGPTAMVVSSFRDQFYLASSVHGPADSNDLTTKAYRFSIERQAHTHKAVGLSFENVIEIDCPEPDTDICVRYPQLCEQNRFVSGITSMAESPADGTLYVTGYTAPKFAEERWLPYYEIESFTTPVLAVVPTDVGNINVNRATGCDLGLPFSIVWTGDKCGGTDLSGDGEVDMEDFAIIANYWLVADCGSLGSCAGADFDGDGTVDLADLAVLVYYWLQSGYEQ